MSMRSFRQSILVMAATAFVATMLATSSALAVVLAYEGFDYAAGTTIGQNGGTGFTGPWAGSRLNTVEGGLTYTDTNGDSLLVSGNHAMATGSGGNGDATRPLAERGTAGTTTWWSFIGQRLRRPELTVEQEQVARSSSLQLRDVGVSTVEKIAVGKPSQNMSSPQDVTFNWTFFHSGQLATLQQTNEPFLEQRFLVVRIDHLGDANASDDARLWIDPLLSVEPQDADADASLIGQLDITFDLLRAFAGNNATVNGVLNPFANMAYDEIRFGTTYADVAPIAAELRGDFNFDTRVDAADYVVWRDGLAGGLYDQDDYIDWKANFGAGTGQGGSSTASVPIPEPASVVLAAVLLVYGSLRPIRRLRTAA